MIKEGQVIKHVLFAATFLSVAVPVTGQPSKWSVAFNAGADISLAGDVHDGGTGTVLRLPTTVQARSYNDVYGNPFTWSVDLGYLVRDNSEVRARVFRTNADASRIQVGTVSTFPLFADFDPYTALGIDFGVRQYWGADTAMFRPYAGASVGFVNLDTINATFTVPAANVTLNDVAMYDSTTALTFAISGGVQVPFGDRFGLQGGVDFRWHGDLDPVDGLDGTGLERINDQSRRWSMPLTVGAFVRF